MRVIVRYVNAEGDLVTKEHEDIIQAQPSERGLSLWTLKDGKKWMYWIPYKGRVDICILP